MPAWRCTTSHDVGTEAAALRAQPGSGEAPPAVIDPDLLHTHFLTGYGYWACSADAAPSCSRCGRRRLRHAAPDLAQGAPGAPRAACGDYVTGDSVDIVADCVKLGARADRVEVVQWGWTSRGSTRRCRGGDPRAIRHSGRRARCALDALLHAAYYNIDLVVDTAARVRSRFPDVHYIIAGNEGDDARFREHARGVGSWTGCTGSGASRTRSFPPGSPRARCSSRSPRWMPPPLVFWRRWPADAPSSPRSSVRVEWIRHEETGLAVKPRDADGWWSDLPLPRRRPLRVRVGRPPRRSCGRRPTTIAT